MHGVILASVSDNSPHGYNLTFAFPMILFIVIAGGLYLIHSRPHKVPGHGPLRISSVAGAHAASASTTSGSVSNNENQATDAGPAADQPAAPGDSAAGTPPSKDEASE